MGTLYVALGFHEADGCVLADKPILHGMESLALERARMPATQRHGVSVNVQMANADRNRYSQPTILAQHGRAPYPECQTLREAGWQLVPEKRTAVFFHFLKMGQAGFLRHLHQMPFATGSNDFRRDRTRPVGVH